MLLVRRKASGREGAEKTKAGKHKKSEEWTKSGKQAKTKEKPAERVRVLCVADVHSNNAALPAVEKLVATTRPNVVLVAGDVTHRGSALFASNFLDAVAKAIKASNLQAKVLAVHGNMDPAEVQRLFEERKTSIHNKIARFKGYVFAGFGGSTHTPHGTPCEYSEHDFKNALEKLVASKTILLTHTSPYGTKADWTGREHIGSKTLREVIEERQPVACVCAHAHEAKGIEKLGATKIVKVPPLSAGEAVVLELPSLRTKFVRAR